MRPFGMHVYHQYTIRLAGGSCDEVQRELDDAGISTMIYYPVPVHRLPVYAWLGYSLPESKAAAAVVLSLPIWPQMEEFTVEQVVDAAARAVRER